MKPQIILLLLFVLGIARQVRADEKFPPSQVDYPAFAQLTTEVMEYRRTRLVDLDTFLRMAAETNTIVLDARSESAYARQHLKGAVGLNFSEFTTDKLAKVIPSKKTRVLIYCNNNVAGDVKNFRTKRFALALNIPTFVNLYGYGYENIYELSELIPVDHAGWEFEGTDVATKANAVK